MNNTRFSTVIHILTLLANNPGQWLSSDWIAGSININPVLVRKELGYLQEKGWVTTRKGKDGGTTLTQTGILVSLADIYRLVKRTNILGKKNLQTNPKCHVGKNINLHLEQLFEETDTVVLAVLEQKNLVDFAANFH